MSRKLNTVRVNSNLSVKNNDFLEKYAHENAMTKSMLVNLAVEEFREKKEAMDMLGHPALRERLERHGIKL